MAQKAPQGNGSGEKGHGKEVLGLSLLFLSCFLFLSVWSFSPSDPALNQAVSPGPVKNLAGIAGAYVAGLLVDLFGMGGVVWPALVCYLGFACFIKKIRVSSVRWLGFFGAYTCFLAWVSHPWFMDVPKGAYGFVGGGYVGSKIIARWTLPYLGEAGAGLLWIFLSLITLQMLLGFRWSSIIGVFGAGGAVMARKMGEANERRVQKKAAKKAAEVARKIAEGSSDEDDADQEDDLAPLPELEEPKKKKSFFDRAEEKTKEPVAKPKPKPKTASPVPKTANAGSHPGVELLNLPPAERVQVDKAELDSMSEALSQCLTDFNVQGEVKCVIPGPVVTQLEFKPAPGVKVSKIENLTDDIALSLKATSVRIEAPIPGKDSVGIEIPNRKRESVFLREIIESSEFKNSKSLLTLALGKDIQGKTAVADLAKMPHLLVAGATGAGKSVGINCFLLSLLYKASPEQVKLLLVDPKRIELAPYAGLPHLVHPVVTDMSMAKSALEWAVFEMECRYDSMALLGVRNIEGFNDKLAKLGEDLPEEMAHLKPMPYLVIIIDELADLMMTAAKEAEQAIVRLAQLARAAGIHMLLATQRPSVDVVTGLIKANFPTRISFSVTSKFDSRTILDSVGAEKLLGRGDMLFKPSGGKLQRMHGAYVDEIEIARIVGFWENAYKQEFELDFGEWRKDGDSGSGGGGAGGEELDDPVYAEAVDFVKEQGKASISLLQRRFRIGFNRAARFIEQMEADGLLGPQEGSKPRRVIALD